MERLVCSREGYRADDGALSGDRNVGLVAMSKGSGGNVADLVVSDSDMSSGSGTFFRWVVAAMTALAEGTVAVMDVLHSSVAWTWAISRVRFLRSTVSHAYRDMLRVMKMSS